MVAGASVFSSYLPAFFLTGSSRAGVIDVSQNVCCNSSIAGTLLVNPGLCGAVLYHAWKVELHYIPPEHILFIQVLSKDGIIQSSHYLNCTERIRPEPHGNTIPYDPEGILSLSQVIGEVDCQIDPSILPQVPVQEEIQEHFSNVNVAHKRSGFNCSQMLVCVRQHEPRTPQGRIQSG
jgi:hypothetical protein